MTTAQSQVPTDYRFSGHESFACRYAWLPKACAGLAENSRLFADEDAAMVELGLGKNMVRSLRFWVEATCLATPSDRGKALELTEFAAAIFGEDGFDPFLEDERTLWLLHWRLASKDVRPLFAWDVLVNRWQRPEFTRSEALRAFTRQSEALGYEHSQVTLAQHLDVFLHTYLPGRSANSEESLDGPLVELELLQPIGERQAETGRWETLYGFRKEVKPEISTILFDYCLMDYARRLGDADQTLTFRDIAVMPGSPGQVFKLPELDVRSRLEERQADEHRGYTWKGSAIHGQLTKLPGHSGPTLAQVYGAA